ncbi:hypothetical protein PRIPAC_70862 [Pristionchus pacificus]|uniref:TAZ-type domain-containing protein n=1 Tax=Pristionchus pacificus TaxID=54126 RepID=A0A2A6B4Y4_PRIPA|nr:hypothetical protein PRIPAC_70862 [Pristionchus pacificus]|eukprot:PDM60939.1 hypothetical protein PRIPAC_54745 [Pristionchus pacificus]
MSMCGERGSPAPEVKPDERCASNIAKETREHEQVPVREQADLEWILHAKECITNPSACTIIDHLQHYCVQFKVAMIHMPACDKGAQCTFNKCYEYSCILRHWNHCWHLRNVACKVCGSSIKKKMRQMRGQPNFRTARIPLAA